MTASAAAALAAAYLLTKPYPDLIAFEVTKDAITLADDVGLSFGGAVVDLSSRNVQMPQLLSGASYFIRIGDGVLIAVVADGIPGDADIGGFMYAPGGNAEERSGGDSEPQIDPHSVWDLSFRPACPDPRGMVLVAGSPAMPGLAPFWIDKNLLAQDHLKGTSRYGAVIADGRNLPDAIDGKGRCKKLNYETAKAIAAHHGKSLPSWVEFVAAAYGATEKTAAEDRPETCDLIPSLSSRFLNQAFGVRWVWGHDGDPDIPRASVFGGSWFRGGDAGSRYAYLDYWPDYSSGGLGARLRSDHLQLA